MLAVGVMILIAGHGIILYYFASHVTLSAAVVPGAIILMIKHHGALGSVYALFRRRTRRNASLDE